MTRASSGHDLQASENATGRLQMAPIVDAIDNVQDPFAAWCNCSRFAYPKSLWFDSDSESAMCPQ